jgi:hypothetical protein
VSTAPGESATPYRRGTLGVMIQLLVTPLLSAALSVFLVLAILHFLTRVPSSAVANGTVSDPRLLRDIVEPFTQNGIVEVKQVSDVVYYPIPYATPPNLTLTSKSEDRSYVIVRQDEFGFAWAATGDLKSVKDLAEKLKGAKDLQGIGSALADLGAKGAVDIRPGGEFTWQARGVRPFTTQAATPPFVQQGTFLMRDGVGLSGAEYFPHPYAHSPNVTLSELNVKIVATTPTGFRWQQIAQQWPAVTVKWSAKGVRTTAEQEAELAKNPPRFRDELFPVIDDKGKLAYAPGEQGAAAFTRPFASPPNVEVAEVIVTEITPQGFKWKHHGNKNPNSGMLSATWTVRGVGAGMVSKSEKP